MVRILIVDDVPKVRRAVGRVLEGEGHQVIEAADAPGAEAALGGGEIDLALIDIWMPGLNGLELMRRIKTRTPDFPVIIMSGGGPRVPLEFLMAVAETEGVAGVLIKPFEDDQLLAAVANALAQP